MIHRKGEPVPRRGSARMGSARTKRLRAKLFFACGGRCCWCGTATVITQGDIQEDHSATIEHVIPLSRGGTNHQKNLAIACNRCNNDRAIKGDPEDYRPPDVEEA